MKKGSRVSVRGLVDDALVVTWTRWSVCATTQGSHLWVCGSDVESQ